MHINFADLDRNMISQNDSSETHDHNPGGYSILWTILYAVLFFPTVFGNSLIIASVAKFRNLRNMTNLLILNLAVADLIVGLVLIPFDFIADRLHHDFEKHKYTCLFRLALFVVSLGASAYSLLLVSIERFVAIVYPLKYPTLLTYRRMKVLIVFGWFVSLTLAMLPLMGWNSYSDMKLVTSVHCVSDVVWKNGYQMLQSILFVTSLTANFLLYCSVVRIAFKRSREENPRHSPTRTTARGETHQNRLTDKHRTQMMAIVLGTFALCWCPYVLVSIVIWFYDRENIRLIRRYVLTLGVLNSGVNWIIYGWKNKGFRTAFLSVLKCRCKDNVMPSESLHRSSQDRVRTITIPSVSDR